MPEPRGQDLRDVGRRGATGARPIAEQWGERLTRRLISGRQAAVPLRSCGRDVAEGAGDLHKRVTLILD